MADKAGPAQRVTWGQAVQLERISTAAWALVGERLTTGQPVVYRLVERATGQQIHTLAPAMVEGLERAGWIERDGAGDARRWGYRITLAGIRARDRGWRLSWEGQEGQEGSEQ